LEDVVRFWE